MRQLLNDRGTLTQGSRMSVEARMNMRDSMSVNCDLTPVPQYDWFAFNPDSATCRRLQPEI